MKKQRLDQLVFDLGFTESRERAKTTIMSGLVFVNGQRVDKPGTAVDPEAKIEVHGEAIPFVSRGGFKLDKALKVFPVDPAGKVCIDCGASTGGFTDVLLQHGAKRVYSVDVGYGQLAWKLRTDERVINLERCNLRYIDREQIPEELDLAERSVNEAVWADLPVTTEWFDTYEESLVYSYIVGTVTAYGLYKSTFGRESGDVNSRIKFTIVNLLGLAQTTIVSLIVCRYLSLCMALHHAQAVAHFIGLASLTVPSYYAHMYFTFAKQNNERELSNILQNAQK